MHEAGYIGHDAPRGLVVFIHGFMGSPRQFDDLVPLAHGAGYSCLTLLLPGHGGSGREFVRCTERDWLGHVLGELRARLPVRGRLYLVGHSMGTLLAVCAAAQPDITVHGLFLMASPLRLKVFGPRSMSVRPVLLRLRSSREAAQAYRTLLSVGRPIAYLKLLRQVRALKRLRREALEKLGALRIPVVFSQSARDEVTHPRSADILEAALVNTPHERIDLTASWHAVYTPGERELLRAKLLALLEADR